MNFEPQKFFIGLMDFFSILLPGALLTFLLMGEVGPVVLGDRHGKLAGAEAWAAFLFASYLFGHLIFLLGSWLDGIYDWLRNRTLNWQIRHVASRGRLLNWPIRVCVTLVFKRERWLGQRLGRQRSNSASNPILHRSAWAITPIAFSTSGVTESCQRSARTSTFSSAPRQPNKLHEVLGCSGSKLGSD